MTEPTRDAQGRTHASIEHTLHAETLAMLAEPILTAYGYSKQAAYAAECVQRVPELEAEVAALAQYKAFVEAIDRGEIDATDYAPQRIGVLPRNGRRWFHAPTALAAYAAATREGTDV